METKTIDVQQAQPSLNDLLSLIATGSEVILTENDEPLAKLVSLKSTAKPRIPGLHLGAIQMSEDFDEPLSDEFWLGEE
ncbi:MAG: toxin-antitoxin (TA) system antitoxin [Acidobacteriota bacterium]|nr:toxin-antitoxin (TA) system antitoxin [Acidobacteriota bacterium]